jgi:CTP:molybdopterin cytidylyltransferase MocA
MSHPLAVVLAAGKGTRMKADRPKVLFQVLGRPLIDYVLDALEAAGIRRQLVVVGYRSDDVRQSLAGRTGVEFVEQTQQLGTGHAVQVCRPALQGHTGPVLIVTGDSPLLQVPSLTSLLDEAGLRHAGQVSRRRELLQDRGGRPRPRRVPGPADLPAGQRQPDGAADHDRQLQAGQRRADHGGDSLLRLRPAGSQGRRARADHGQAGGQPDHAAPAPTAC